MKAIIRSHGSKLSRIVYVSDAGKIETAYWKNVLRHLHVDGRRIKIERIVDYYHASLIGSGIVESPCKQILTEHLKLSGLRWSHAGAQGRASGRARTREGEQELFFWATTIRRYWLFP